MYCTNWNEQTSFPRWFWMAAFYEGSLLICSSVLLPAENQNFEEFQIREISCVHFARNAWQHQLLKRVFFTNVTPQPNILSSTCVYWFFHSRFYILCKMCLSFTLIFEQFKTIVSKHFVYYFIERFLEQVAQSVFTVTLHKKVFLHWWLILWQAN